METIQVNVKRDKALLGWFTFFRIWVNGKKVAKVFIGGRASFEIPNQRAVLEVSMFGSFWYFSKVRKEVLLFPEYCQTNVINCCIKPKMNWVEMLIYTAKRGWMEIEVEYC